MATKNITFNIDEQLAYRLKLEATVQKTTQKELISKYITEGLNRDKKQRE